MHKTEFINNYVLRIQIPEKNTMIYAQENKRHYYQGHHLIFREL
jgi:hypothetical protein